MSEEGAVRRRRSRAEAETLVAEFEASGLMREAFCQLRGLAAGTLDKYRRRVQRGCNRRAGLYFLWRWYRQGPMLRTVPCATVY